MASRRNNAPRGPRGRPSGSPLGTRPRSPRAPDDARNGPETTTMASEQHPPRRPRRHPRSASSVVTGPDPATTPSSSPVVVVGTPITNRTIVRRRDTRARRALRAAARSLLHASHVTDRPGAAPNSSPTADLVRGRASASSSSPPTRRGGVSIITIEPPIESTPHDDSIVFPPSTMARLVTDPRKLDASRDITWHHGRRHRMTTPPSPSKDVAWHHRVS